jgi:tRNA-splicing ligase RtcB
MISRKELHRINNYLWELPATHREDMRVPARIYATDELIDALMQDRTVDQLINVATLPGIQKAAMVMPDAHEGYGFPIGGVAAIDYETGIISPGGIGYDINCGVRLMLTPVTYKQVQFKLPEFTHELARSIPKGVGRGGSLVLTDRQMEEVLSTGAEWAVDQGYGYAEDLAHIESQGRLADADPQYVSDKAKQRGHDQLGTIGAGNHFVEVDRVEEIIHSKFARAYGLSADQIVILIHTGSRGLGHQVATDYLRSFVQAMPSYGLNLPDRELASAPFHSPHGQHYYRAMAAAANFAWCNRQIISWEVRQAWEQIFDQPGQEVQLLYDVAHNMAKIERHMIDGNIKQLIVHRKGATRSFGPGSDDIPDDYRMIGQPVLIPGSMGTHSYVLAGASSSENRTFGSCCHGAGRRMSRTAAKKLVNAPSLKQELQARAITIEAGSYAGLAEEAPLAYKDVELVVDTVHQAGLATKVARLQPVGVIKG